MTVYSANKGPNVNFDGRKFKRVVCFIGKNLDYSASALELLLKQKIVVDTIVGKEAELVWNRVSTSLKIFDVKIIQAKRPWQSDDFNRLKSDCKLLGINCGYDYLIPSGICNQIPIINVHPSALPFNRGSHHSFWGIIDSTILGATLHWMTEGLDEGPIIAQKTFEDDKYASADRIQNKSELLCLKLLSENIQSVMTGNTTSIPQGLGTHHSKKDIVTASTLSVEDNISVGHLFDLCRATNSKKNGFFVIKNNKKFKIIIDKIDIVD